MPSASHNNNNGNKNNMNTNTNINNNNTTSKSMKTQSSASVNSSSGGICVTTISQKDTNVKQLIVETSTNNSKLVNNNEDNLFVNMTANNSGNIVDEIGNISANQMKISETSGSPTTTCKDSNADALMNPMKLTFTLIEHKIRNLEKRKTKLESYREFQASGKELSSDQRAAVAKYDAVISTLEFAHHLVKQMQQFVTDAEKEQKKQARLDLIARTQAQTAKIREVLIFQNIMSCFSDSAIRFDFANGENGAVKIAPSDIDIICKFCRDVQVRRRETSLDMPFNEMVQRAAEIFSITIDGRPKQYGDTTYEHVREIFQSIQDCGYLDNVYVSDDQTHGTDTNDEEEIVIATEIHGDSEFINPDIEIVTDEDMEKFNSESSPVTGEEETTADSVSVIPSASSLSNNSTYATATAGNATAEIMENVNFSHTQLPTHVVNDRFDTQNHTPGQSRALNNLPMQTVMTSSMSSLISTGSAFLSGPSLSSQSDSTTSVMIYPPKTGCDVNTLQQSGLDQVTQSIAEELPGAKQPVIKQQRSILRGNANSSGAISVNHTPSDVYNPTCVQTVEQSLFNQPQHFLHQMRPLAEVIGGSNFYFLQDSELDSPDGNMNQTEPNQNPVIFEQEKQHQSQTQFKMTDQNISRQHPQPMHTQQPQEERHIPNYNGNDQGTTDNVQLHESKSLPQQSEESQHNQMYQTQIQSQTFTNQSFPLLPQPAPALAQHVNRANNSPLFPQKPSVIDSTQQLFSSVTQHLQNTQLMSAPTAVPVPGNTPNLLLIANEHHQQQPMAMISHLGGTKVTPLFNSQSLTNQQTPPNVLSQTNITQQQHVIVNDIKANSQNSHFHFENSPMVTGLRYDQQISASGNALNSTLNVGGNTNNGNDMIIGDQKTNKTSLSNTIEADILHEWGESNQRRINNNIGGRSQNVGGESKNILNVNKWNGVNANVVGQQQLQQSQKIGSNQHSHITDWTTNTPTDAVVASAVTTPLNTTKNTAKTTVSISETNTNVGGAPVTDIVAVSGDTGDNFTVENRHETSNHWHAQPDTTVTAYGRGSSTRSTTGNNYQRRNDDRRSGANMSNYRGNRSNYGPSGQPNNTARGGGMYFRNNDNSVNNNYYQNCGNGAANGNGNSNGGGAHMFVTKDTIANRYETGSGGNSYRNFRGVTPNNSSNGRNNGSSSRSIAPLTRSVGGNVTNTGTNTNTYMNSRPANNRVLMTLENKH